MYFERTIQLIGQEAFDRLGDKHVLIAGVGGVGGWCAETLVRTGVGHLTIIDMDIVSASNLNRQLVATRDNIGLSKADEMKKRLLSINPDADIRALSAQLTADGLLDFGTHTVPMDWTPYDCVIDAIDTLDCKMRLIYDVTTLQATETGTTDERRPLLFSSMGAGRKMDTEQIRIAEFWKVEGCPLARSLRTRMRKSGMLPKSKFYCVYSPEVISESGTLAPIVGIFGMKLAALAIQSLIK